jgi:hypothetical protein
MAKHTLESRGVNTSRAWDPKKPHVIDPRPELLASGFGERRTYSVTRLVHPSSEDPRFYEQVFNIIAATGPEACRIADEAKYSREVELGWLKPKTHRS